MQKRATMNKKELVAFIAKESELTQDSAEKALNTIISSITDALKKGDDVALVGFGTFKVSKRAARTGRNPKTGAALEIAARNSPGFSAGKALKEAVN
ncbi:HU family DNA-binding protein [Sulfuriferula nivalis]|nr:HU family DNA-binding protein [Sulfuriferula nivalis]